MCISTGCFNKATSLLLYFGLHTHPISDVSHITYISFLLSMCFFQIDKQLENYSGLPTVKLGRSKSHYESSFSREAVSGYGYPSELSTLPELAFSEVVQINVQCVVIV